MSRSARERRTFFWEEPILEESVASSMLELRQESAGLHVCVPHLPAQLDAGAIEAEEKRLFDQMLTTFVVRDPVMWFYTPMAIAFAGHVPASGIVYDCMDELSAFQGAPPALFEREAKLFARADVVFTGGQSLYEAKRAKHPRVLSFPSSVDREHFARARDFTSIPEPADQRAITRPRLGYFGVIDERIDLDLIATIADTQPTWQIVMIGPVVKIAQESLPQRPNIHYLGKKPYEDLPTYLSGWDVALMPFALNEATRFISPTKTLEYLAAGKPVVSTAIRDVVKPYGERGLVRIGDRSSFVAEIAAALAEDPAPRRALGDAFVAMTSWDRTWASMSQTLDAATAQRQGALNTLEDGSLACSTI
ncbi:MAG: glycosyltransferase [Myxococcota bacterium]|nr:glycosyltransferase [Myxococcota bacterium]